jgi:hypothetical protein
LLSGVAIAVSGSNFAHAADIAVLNAGFEDPVIADGDEISPGGPDWSTGSYLVDDPTDWIPGEAVDAVGLWNPDAGSGFSAGAFAGENTGWTISNVGADFGLSQVLGDALQANKKYVLSAQVGNAFYNESEITADYRIEFLAGGVLLESVTGDSPTAGNWELQSLIYTSDSAPPQLGEDLEIRLIAVAYADGGGVDGYEVDWDAVEFFDTTDFTGLDFNSDGVVNIGDFLLLVDNFNESFSSLGEAATKGDFNFDGRVNMRDFVALHAALNQPAGVAAVPEPASWLLLMGCSGMLACFRRRRPGKTCKQPAD